jgi:hypothetical protein
LPSWRWQKERLVPLVFLHGVKTLNLAAKVRRSYPTQVLPLPGGDERLAAEMATLLDKAATAGYRVGATPLNRFLREHGEQILAGLPEARAAEAVAQLRALQRLYQPFRGDAPFRPHLIARHRQSAYMVKTVTAYLDNLIDWGDALFRQDTEESVNEATRIYARSRSSQSKHQASDRQDPRRRRHCRRPRPRAERRRPRHGGR